MSMMPSSRIQGGMESGVAVEVPVLLTAGARSFEAVSRTLSPGRVVLATTRAFPVGTDVELELTVEDELVRASGRIERAPAARADEEPGLEVVFTAIDDDGRVALQELCEVRGPMRFVDPPESDTLPEALEA